MALLPARSLFVLGTLLACSGESATANDDAGANSAGRETAGAPASGVGHGNAGRGGNAAEGGGAGVAGVGAAGMGGGAATSGAGGGSAGTAGAAPAQATATLVAIQTSGVSGSAVYTQVGDHLELKISLMGCAAGVHALHLHVNAACDDAGNAAGGHWSPSGELVPDVTCAADGSAELSFDAPPGTWTLGPPAVSDVLAHAVMLHAGPSAEPGARIACGIPAKAQ